MDITVQTIADSAVDLADMQRSSFINQTGTAGTELMRYLNIAYTDLYAQIILSKETYYTTSTDVAVTGATDTYALPTGFYKLDGVDLKIDTSGRALTLQPFKFAERNKFRSGMGLSVAPFGYVFRYIIVGSNIKLVPFPSQAATITIWYTPEPTAITSLATTLSLPPGGSEYISLYVAEMMLVKEESDVTALNAKRMEVIDQLKNSLKDRDAGSPSYITDVSNLNIGAFYPFGTFE